MKILIRTHNSPERRFLVKLSDKKLIDKVRKLVNKGLRSEAIKVALDEGKVIREICKKDELTFINAELILTENTAHYDLM